MSLEGVSPSLREVRRGGIQSVREKVVCARVPAACTEAGRKHGFFPRKCLTGQRCFSLPREKEARTGLLCNEKLVALTLSTSEREG